MSYVWEKKISKRKHEFGKGTIEGVAGPEAANLRRALQISGGDLTPFVQRPASLIFLLVCAAVVVVPAVMSLRRRSVSRRVGSGRPS
jgi:TctA family transporter